jgi:hypothetical protein
VYTSLGGPPNNWPREKTQWNILRKIEPDTVQGSNWDPDWSGSGSDISQGSGETAVIETAVMMW